MPGLQDILAQGQGPVAAPGQGYADMQQPIPPEVQAMNKPATSPEELEVRKAGWLQVAQRVAGDPNLMRAIGYAGASLMQPKDWGQTTAGQVGQSYMVGQSAYDFGKQAEIDQRTAAAKEGRAQETHVVDIAGKQALTAGRQAETQGQLLSNKVKLDTMPDIIKHATLVNENINAQIRAAATKQEKEQLDLARDKHMKEIEDSIPDEEKKRAFREKLRSDEVKNKAQEANAVQSRAAAGASSAHANYYNTQAAGKKIENEALLALPITERLAASGGRSTSGATATSELYRKTWAEANPGATPQQIAAATEKFMSGAKNKPDDENFIKWAGLYGTGDYGKDRAAYDAIAGGTPRGSTPGGAAVGKAPTQADLEFTAKKHGITIEEVKKRLGIK